MIEYTDEQHDSLIRGHRKQLADAQATVEALQRERDRLREALERVLEQWVNGRKVKDGIGIEVLVAAVADLAPAVCPDCDGDGAVDSGGTDPNGHPLMRRCGCREKGGDGE